MNGSTYLGFCVEMNLSKVKQKNNNNGGQNFLISVLMKIGQILTLLHTLLQKKKNCHACMSRCLIQDKHQLTPNTFSLRCIRMQETPLFYKHNCTQTNECMQWSLPEAKTWALATTDYSLSDSTLKGIHSVVSHAHEEMHEWFLTCIVLSLMCLHNVKWYPLTQSILFWGYHLSNLWEWDGLVS